jgi:hypothetical protein
MRKKTADESLFHLPPPLFPLPAFMRFVAGFSLSPHHAPSLVSLCITALLATFLVATTAYSAPKADLLERWEAHDPESSIAVDHRTWDALLDKYLAVPDPSSGTPGINRFRYGAVTTLDRTALEIYLDDLQAIKVSSLNRPEQLAYWINLYNALTVNTILKHYPVGSIRDIDISPGLFSNGPWDAKLLQVEKQKISLNDIEHRILRPIWQDPRIHYAVNCAALGCPDLQDRAFVPEHIDRMLDEAAVGYINHPRGVGFDDKGGLTLSSIYRWFGEDFGEDVEEVLEHIRQYASDDLKEKIPTEGKVKVKYRYDWSLNDAEER